MATEKRLIDADLADSRLADDNSCGEKFPISWFRSWLALQETVDAIEVVHGSWFDTTHMIPAVACSVCGGLVRKEYTQEHINRRKYNFCPYCGAKMDGDKNGSNK